jgi:LPXTG-motif cell wall-anchored protein
MNRLNALVIASCLGLASGSLWADQWNKKTILTVNETVIVPGGKNTITLEPGKYVMKLMDSPSNRHIVQVFNEEESRLLTTVLAIPNYRLQPTGDTKFGFWETPAGQPKAMRSWFYPGDNFGQEFVYPKQQAIEIAKVTHERVPMTTQEDLASAQVSTVDQAGTVHELDKETYRQTEVAQAQPTPAPEPAPAPEAAPEPAPAAAPEPTPAPDVLPTTGSEYPALAFAGLLALAAAGLARVARRSA